MNLGLGLGFNKRISRTIVANDNFTEIGFVVEGYVN